MQAKPLVSWKKKIDHSTSLKNYHCSGCSRLTEEVHTCVCQRELFLRCSLLCNACADHLGPPGCSTYCKFVILVKSTLFSFFFWGGVESRPIHTFLLIKFISMIKVIRKKGDLLWILYLFICLIVYLWFFSCFLIKRDNVFFFHI